MKFKDEIKRDIIYAIVQGFPKEERKILIGRQICSNGMIIPKSKGLIVEIGKLLNKGELWKLTLN